MDFGLPIGELASMLAMLLGGGLIMGLFEHFKAQVREHGVSVSSGSFGAEMKVDLANDGPVTIWLDTARR